MDDKKETKSLWAFLRGLTIWRLSRFGGDFAVNATRWLYLSNHAYKGDKRYYLRLGKRPGHVFTFGGRRG